MILINTSKGDIRIEMHKENAPNTVENFLNYVRNGFYNNTIFHRVIDGFMIQGGGLTADMDQKATETPVKNEAKQAKPNKRGTIAMARTMDPHSATAQFFINVADNAFLNFSGEHSQGYGYCVFGEVVEGMDVVDAIAKVKTGQHKGHADVPVEEVTILEIKEEV
ncbi:MULTISPECIES: peptidylprolyl isomerase [Legionella]|uniref:Peptidyl-prolyl cis-trans isomerase n=1 Tax=Legionella drozanskii LLAP-1 TaxID=1212489 RepID=A0A0W0SVJ0_9GAMM|nr:MULTISPECIES: peptidylprolyl isomerase [Legionella]KTC87360.1 Peptidyl-prolyl cis-trans isomerase B (cyclophilin-type PPIase family) [Legionella drozanskii LLAP-1]PJE08430.1 MAG: peptidylprolyl isomerase [Legionella sp.]